MVGVDCRPSPSDLGDSTRPTDRTKGTQLSPAVPSILTHRQPDLPSRRVTAVASELCVPAFRTGLPLSVSELMLHFSVLSDWPISLLQCYTAETPLIYRPKKNRLDAYETSCSVLMHS
jgi:hypothetical protein